MVLTHYHAGAPVETKADSSPVTAADRAAHQLIVRRLADWDPSVPVISEEGAIPTASERAGWSQFWLVDPLDGTKEFIKKNGEFTVNIALIDRGVPVLGVIDAPALGVTYYAGDGLGSWRRSADGRVHRIGSRPPLPGHRVRVAESRSHPSPTLEQYLTTIPVAGRVAVGSSLKFCLVAEGAADVYPRFGPTMEWDVAAGDCIFRNSGIGRPRTSPLRYNKPDLRNGDFVIGRLDSELDTGSAAGRVIWFTGLSGAGKTTIARRLVERLEATGTPVEFLDGDAIRDLFPATGFSREDRDAHVRRVGYLASRLERHGITVVTSLVSPYRAARDFVRSLCRRFVEVHVATPLEVCEQRDIKGLYAKARRGEIKQFTGIDDPYEAPASPEISIDTTTMTVDEAAESILTAPSVTRVGGPPVGSA